MTSMGMKIRKNTPLMLVTVDVFYLAFTIFGRFKKFCYLAWNFLASDFNSLIHTFVNAFDFKEG